MNCIGALRRCSPTFAVLVRSCGFGLVVDCALIALGADGGTKGPKAWQGLIALVRAGRWRRHDHIVFMTRVVRPPCSPIARNSVSIKKSVAGHDPTKQWINPSRTHRSGRSAARYTAPCA